MPLISVITAAYAPGADAGALLSETASSIAAAELPPGWSLEWVVQEDGEAPQLASLPARWPFARYEANGHRYGPAITRNLALARASGVLIQALDADDHLLPGALTTLIPRFAEHQIHWAIGQADDLLPDGTRRAYPSPIPFGLIKAGEVNKFAEEHGANWPIHAAAVMMRTVTLRALGGWTGIPYDDELVTFATLSQCADGWYDEALTWLYRHHPGQLHRTEASQARSAACRRIALQRVRSAAAAGLSFAPGSAVGFNATAGNMTVGPVSKDTTLPAAAAC